MRVEADGDACGGCANLDVIKRAPGGDHALVEIGDLNCSFDRRERAR
jgi:hypothetical protein